MSKKISIRLSGVTNTDGLNLKDGRLKCNYVYAISNAQAEVGILPDGTNAVSYSYVLNHERDNNPILITYQRDPAYRTERYSGLYALDKAGNSYSFYRREYETFYKNRYDAETGQVVTENQTFVGDWKPVAVNITESSLRDFNITSGRSYQYILYPNYTSQKQQYALAPNSLIPESESHTTGDTFKTQWDTWSLVELKLVENQSNSPLIKKTYVADTDNIWIFKFNLNTGAQTQNLSKNEINTLGTYSRIGYGIKNYISGEVSCLLGSEIIPYSETGYIERLRDSIGTPMSTNEKVRMLKQWRDIAFSKNPKLLKDAKGQSWIVQIFSNSNTPYNTYKNQPDTISFSWKQIEDVENCIIYGYGGELEKTGECSSEWKEK